MQTNISQSILDTRVGKSANDILRRCVHCGFCIATCPTYRILGDELDSPRGRIYLIKQMLEGQDTGRHTQLHLDRCLSCRACETTCPSGVEYGHLLDMGRSLVDSRVTRPYWEKMARSFLCFVLPYPQRFRFLTGMANLFRWLLPASIKSQITRNSGRKTDYPDSGNKRIVLSLKACVQSVLEPGINVQAATLLDGLGIQWIEIESNSCCGAIHHHLNDESAAMDMIRKNIDAWWPTIEQGNVEAICLTASGCAAMVQDYGSILQDDTDYADKARHISGLCKDISEIFLQQEGHQFKKIPEFARVSFQSPCTLQHAMKVSGKVEHILGNAGYKMLTVADSHLCCGSAGTYSVFHPVISGKLRNQKLESLTRDRPDCIATANIGCLRHLQANSPVPVVHWLELLEKA